MERLQFVRNGLGEEIPTQHGVKAQFIRIGETGVGYKRRKAEKTPKDTKHALEVIRGLKKEYDLLKGYLGPYIPPTQFAIGQDESGEIAITCFQREIKDGMSIKKALKLARRENLSTEHIVDLYERAVKMHDETKNVPDFNGTGRFLGWHRPNSTRNVLVTISPDGKLWPNVVDVGLIHEGFTERIHIGILGRAILDQYRELRTAA